MPSSRMNRRQLLGATGAAGGGLLAGSPCLRAASPTAPPQVLEAGDRVELAADPEALIAKVYQLGHDYEKEHGGCARCTVAALQDALPFVAVDEGLFRGSTCLDGGATPVDVQNCGAFTGAGMVIGYVCGSRRDETFHGNAKLAHQLLHKVYDRFAEHYGTVLCRDVRKGANRDCNEVVGRAAKWVAEVLLAEFAGYQPPLVTTTAKEDRDVLAEAKVFLKRYEEEVARLGKEVGLAEWKAANSGKKEDFDHTAECELAIRRFHSDADAYRRAKELSQSAAKLPPREARALEVAELAYRANQLPPDLQKRMVTLSTEIERTFKTFRGELEGKRLSNNDLLELLRKENDSNGRRRIWEALKQVGEAVAPKLVELAKIRNEAARKLEFANYWEMQTRLQEHDPQQLLSIFDELERLTREPFSKAKEAMDRERAAKSGIALEEVMPWHYDNPFFQSAPPSAAVDVDEFYSDKTKEDLVEYSRKFYRELGLPVDEVLARSDLYEREGKDQHAFCIDIDHAGDVRILCNVKPTADWMDTTLHELGHAVYDLHVDRTLPYNLRRPAHAFTTEGVAMLLGALGQNPAWMTANAGADPERVSELSQAIFEQRRRDQLVFARWTLVMLHFEKALYEDPEGDLNQRWWDDVVRFQQIRRPEGRNTADWAAKPHFTIAPVYYHNYMLGELFASQLRHVLAGRAGHTGPTRDLRFDGRRDFGDFLREKVFYPGNAQPWPEFVARATGEPLTARYFAAEVTQH
ncbi:MAG: peptidase M3 [Rhodopirellula sp.]|nr:peptidase M3 [Rhodopirellula sp.]